jgi:hypothetical protein
MALDSSQFYTDPATGTNYTSYASYQQNTQGVALPSTADANTGQAISVSQLQPTTPLTVPQAQPTADALPGATAGATQTVKSLEQQFKEADQALPEYQQYKTLTASLESLLPGLTGQGADQLQAEQTAGLPQQKQQLAQLNAQLLQKVAEATKTSTSYDQLIANLESPTNPQQQGIPMNAIIGQQAQARKLQLAENNSSAANIGLLQAYAQGLAGNIQAAQDSVNRAIDLKYQDRQAEVDLRMQQLNLIKDSLNKQEDVIWKSLERKYQEEQQAIADKKAQDQIVQNMAIQAAQNGADSATLKAIGSAKDPIIAAVSYAQFSKTQSNLKNLSQYTITSPFVLTAGGEVQNSQTGYAYTSEQDFQKKTGMTVDQAVAKGAIKPLGLSKAEQQQGFDNSIKLKELGVSQMNAQTSRLNALKPDSKIVDNGDGTKSVITTDYNGNVVSSIPIAQGSNGKNVLKLAQTADQVSIANNILSDKALGGAVGPNAFARQTNFFTKFISSPNFNAFTGATSNFVSNVEQLRSQLNLQALENAKAQGATFGALSDQELKVLATSATKLGNNLVKNKSGDVIGYNLSEKDFKNEIQKVNNFAKLDYIIKGGDPAEVGVKVEDDGQLTTINWDGTVSVINP